MRFCCLYVISFIMVCTACYYVLLLVEIWSAVVYKFVCLEVRIKVISESRENIGKMESGSLVAVLCLLSFVILQVGYLNILSLLYTLS